MRLGQDYRFAGIKPRHRDTALNRIGAGRKNARPPGPIRIAQQVGDNELGGTGAIFVGKTEIGVAIALHGAAQLGVNGGMAVAHTVGDKLAHEIQHACAIGEGEPIAVHTVDCGIAMLRSRLQAMQIVSAVPLFQLLPIACHYSLAPFHCLLDHDSGQT